MGYGKERKKAEERKEQIWFFYSGPFLIVFLLSLHPPPLLLTRMIFLFRCNLPPSSLVSLSLLFFFSSCLFPPLCVFFYKLLFFGGMSVAEPHPSQTASLGWYPALYSPVHCNSATVSTRFVVDGWDHPPLLRMVPTRRRDVYVCVCLFGGGGNVTGDGSLL